MINHKFNDITEHYYSTGWTSDDSQRLGQNTMSYDNVLNVPIITS